MHAVAYCLSHADTQTPSWLGARILCRVKEAFTTPVSQGLIAADLICLLFSKLTWGDQSKTLELRRKRNRNYVSLNLKLFAIIFGMKKFTAILTVNADISTQWTLLGCK